MNEELSPVPFYKKKIFLLSVVIGLAVVLLGFLVWAAVFFLQFSVYKDDAHLIRIKYPANWKVVAGYQGTLVAFIAPKENALDAFQENLNITVTDMSKNLMTLEAYSGLAIKQMSAVFKENIEVVESKAITFAGFPSYLYEIKAPKPQDLYVKVIWFMKGKEVYTITYVAQLFEYKKYSRKFDEMLRSFSIPLY